MPGQGLVERRSHARRKFLGEIEHWHRPRELDVGGLQWPLENRVIAEAGSRGLRLHVLRSAQQCSHDER
jgi:hypothetical protein